MFGGGYTLIPIVERELIKKRNWITHEEMMDYFTVAQITPGIIAVNLATFIGFKRKGIFGGIISTSALVLPGVLLMVIISHFLKRFSEYEIVNHAFTGIRLAVCALIIDIIFRIHKGIIQNFKSVIVFVCVFILSAVFGLSPVFIVTGAGLAGFLFFRSASPPKINAEKEEEEKEI